MIILPVIHTEPPQLAQAASTDSMQLISEVNSLFHVVESVQTSCIILVSQ